MATTLQQTNRVASLKTRLGSDKVVLTRFWAEEGLSELFKVDVEGLSSDADIDLAQVVGTGACVSLTAEDGQVRYFHGRVAEAEWVGVEGRSHAYRLVLRPWLWLLSHTANCRIFESNKDIVQIISSVFDQQGFEDYRFDLAQSYPKLEYCVQYRESDLDFVCRLMEEAGIYYYFEHSDSKHTLVMVDRASSHKPVPGLGSLPVHGLENTRPLDRQHLVAWRAQRCFATGRSMYNEYDYARPKAALKAEHRGSLPFAHNALEVYDYPGRYEQASDGSRMVKARQEGFEARDQIRRAAGSAGSLAPGYTVQVGPHPREAEAGAYLVLHCRHSFLGQSYATRREDETGYSGEYRLLPTSLQFRAPIATPRPRIHGTQTARVVGRQGEEIDVDEHGRILVEFHWERDDLPSRRVRVAQVWAGRNWGSIVIPRIGMEVVVTFLEGDPDQPLVIGCVYNGDNKPPYKLPDEKNISGIKSESTKGGSGYNEFIFDDTKNQEKVRLHAEKDLESTVDNTELRTIKGEQVGSPKGTYARKTVIEKGDEVLEVATGHRDEKIKQGDDKLVVGQGNRTCEISMGNDNLTIKMGNRTTKLDLGKDFTEAMQSITLKVASSKLTIDPTGITLDAPMITFKGGALIKSSAPMTNISSDAMTIVKGGIVTIN